VSGADTVREARAREWRDKVNEHPPGTLSGPMLRRAVDALANDVLALVARLERQERSLRWLLSEYEPKAHKRVVAEYGLRHPGDCRFCDARRAVLEGQ